MKKYQKNKKAFSLIEIGIVMIVIGILIAAVMSGRDVISAADVKTFYQKFAGKWQTVATSYYDRTRQNLGDNDGDGYMDDVDVDDNITDKLLNSGINPCKMLVTNISLTGYDCHPGQYKVYSDNAESIVQVALKAIGTTNYILFKNMPLDYAIAMDRYTDTYADGKNGNTLCFGKTSDDSNTSVSYSTLNKSDLVSLGIGLEH
jgi:hypothetical protein